MTWITDIKYNKNANPKGSKISSSNLAASYFYGDGDNTGLPTISKIPNLNELILQERSQIISKNDQELDELETKLAILLNTERTENKTFLDWQKKRALNYEIESIQKRIEELQNQSDLKKFDRVVEPFLQAYIHEEDITSMERNVPPRRPRIRREISSGGASVLIGREDASHDKRMNIIVNECLSEIREKHPAPIIQSSEDQCPVCQLPYVLVSALAAMVCQKCGRKQNNHIDATISCPFGRETDNSFHYKRINHLNESLMLFQAKESTVIPQEVLIKTMERLSELGYMDRTKITRWKTRDALRDLGLRKYYENEAQITFLITGIRPPQMSSAQEERMRMRFCAIQGPFRKHCPPDRKNFFSYPYVLYKFSDIEGWSEFLICFRLHKGGDKRRYLDKLWKKICEELDGQDPTMPWPYRDTPPPSGDEKMEGTSQFHWGS